MKIYLSEKDKKIAGVCGGIAEAYNLDSTMVRLCFIVIAIISSGIPAVIGYIIAAMIIPAKPHGSSRTKAHTTHTVHADKDENA